MKLALLLGLLATMPAAADPATASGSTTPAIPGPADVERFDGERITWQVRYAGLNAGTAWASAAAGPDGSLVLEGGAQNAPWYASLYSIDDWVRSTSVPGQGALRYETRFREGGFHQDQVMELGDASFDVWRKQRIDGEWREWERSYDAHDSAEDPISAVHRIRTLQDQDRVTTELGPGWSFMIFSGEKTWPLIVTEVGRETLDVDVLGTVQTRVVELHTQHAGMLEQKGRFRIWLTDDDARIPVKLQVKTNFGAIRADLLAYEAASWTQEGDGLASD